MVLTDLNKTLTALTKYTNFMIQIIKILIFYQSQQHRIFKRKHAHTLIDWSKQALQHMYFLK